MPRSPTTQALDRVITREDDFATLLDALFSRRYTGAILLHFRNGVPKIVELPGVQITIRAGEGLDSPPPTRPL